VSLRQEVTRLEEAVAHLNARWDDLDKRISSVTSPMKRLEIVETMEMVSLKIMHLETKRNHLKAALVTVRPPTAEEKSKMTSALQRLSIAVKKDQTWAAARKTIMSALQAANEIRSNIETRQA